MIAFLEGIYAGSVNGSALVNVGGVGFEVAMAQTALASMPAVGDSVSVYTYMQVREDAMALYGFLTLEEKALFERLISVSGVGPKVALSALGSYDPSKMAALIAAQDIGAIQKIPGIGKKMASRIVLELKGSMDEGLDSLFSSGPAAQDTSMAKAQEALMAMGFTTTETELALKGAPEDGSETALISFALKKLGS